MLGIIILYLNQMLFCGYSLKLSELDSFNDLPHNRVVSRTDGFIF